VFSAGLSGFALGRFDWSVALCGIVMGSLFGRLAVAERKRMEHYGCRPKRERTPRAARA